MSSFFCGCCCACQEEKKGHGEPLTFNPDFKGPIRGKNRCPTDVLCLLLFVAFVCGMFAIGVYGWINGNPQRLLHPVDSNGRLCGLDPGVEDRPYLLFFDYTRCIRIVGLTDLLSGNFDASDIFTCATQQVCVTECPTATESGIRANPVCVDGVNTTQFDVFINVSLLDAPEATAAAATLVQLILQEKCAPYYISSESLANRCIPTFTQLDGLIDLANTTNFNASEVPDLTSLVFTITLNDILNGTLTQALFLNIQAFVFGVLQDLQVVWPAILIAAGIALVLCYLYIFLMRYFAGIVIAVSIILGLLLIAVISAFCYFQFYCFQTGLVNIPSLADGITNSSIVLDFLNTSENFAVQGCQFTNPVRDFFAANAPWYEYQRETWLAIGIVGTVIFLILLIVIIVFASKIAISVAIIKEASKAIGYIPGVVFYPILTWLFIIITIAYWAVVALFLYTSSVEQFVITIGNTTLVNVSVNSNSTDFISGTPCDINIFNGTLGSNNTKMVFDVATGTNVTVSCMFDRFFTSNILLYMQLYMLFGMLWVSNYFIALGECTIAGAFGSYYWAWGDNFKSKLKNMPLLTTGAAFLRAIFFHTGSLAFGALIIAIIQLIRIILAYIQKKLKQNEASKIAHAILTCMQCCFFLLEKVFRYVNRHAYIEIAIYGYDFCRAACHAVKLILRNVITTAVKDRIVGLLLFMGKLCIVAIMTTLAYLGFGQYEEQGRIIWQRELNYYLVPLIIVMILTYLIASGFMSVYHMGVDTIYICALEDQERNNGFDKPYFMNKSLQTLMGVKNRVGDEHVDGQGNVHVELENVDK